MNELKILVYDFDYIMYSFLKRYSQFFDIPDDVNSTKIWEYVENVLKIENMDINYDANIYVEMFKQLMFQRINKNAKCLFVDNHKDVINILQSFEDALFDITTIGYHSGTSIISDHIDEMINFDKYDDSEWLTYLFMKNLTTNITWFKTPNSKLIDTEINGFGTNVNIKGIRDLSDLQNEKYDMIFVIKSEKTVPYKFSHLYHLMDDILNYQTSQEEEK